MPVSLFQIFSIGIGPSSSHTVGPMRAAYLFISDIENNDRLDEVANIRIELFGSLAMTGHGHGTDIAVLLGLEGEKPEDCDPTTVDPRVAFILSNCTINLLSKRTISFHKETDLIFHKGRRLPYHSNAMRFKAFDQFGAELYKQIFYSVGGGFTIDHEQIFTPASVEEGPQLPYPFTTCEELLSHCREKTIAQVMLENEKAWRTEEEIRAGILKIWGVMKDSVRRGCETEGVLPGGLEVKRRASSLLKRLENAPLDHASILDWTSLFALAVNEENAAGGRIVTAPTNGAAGVIPAVLHYYMKFCENPTEDDVITFFLTTAAVGILYKEGASFSAAEMGCQGEVGVACSMAAAGLAAILGATNKQIESAAEIGMEHNLGLTCDPIAGLVQVPCIERNTMGAIQAINAARLAMQRDTEPLVTLDQVIKTMHQTGLDMKHHYKETSEGGLAIHVSVGIPEC
ncbi:MAG: L-serine ammonia-lyase [Simkaniaceae bacterium]|nr:L-serine ammonia-lyase [Candidatus Sacchlamyda saccharinae]